MVGVSSSSSQMFASHVVFQFRWTIQEKQPRDLGPTLNGCNEILVSSCNHFFPFRVLELRPRLSFDIDLVRPPIYSCNRRFSFSSLSWSCRTSSILFASACKDDCRVCAWLSLQVSTRRSSNSYEAPYSCKLFLTPSSSLSRSSLVLRGLIARASSGGYSGFSRW